jgi:hypothetical protein
MAMSKMVVDHQACLGFRIRDKQKKQKEKNKETKRLGNFYLRKWILLLMSSSQQKNGLSVPYQGAQSQ